MRPSSGLGVVLSAVVLAACSSVSAGTASRGRPSGRLSPIVASPAAGSQTLLGGGRLKSSEPALYERAIDDALADGLEVWVDADLAGRWLEGPRSFAKGVDQVAALADRPGVVGIKIADELGYHDGFDNDPSRIRAFLADAARALHAAAPGRLILVDLVVPQLGCAPGLLRVIVASTLCELEAGQRYPALTLGEVDSYIASGTIDVVDLSTSLLSGPTYRRWGIDLKTAQEAAWRFVIRRGWSQHVQLRTRHAFAHAGVYEGTDTARQLQVFVGIPTAQGAAGVDIWTWRQQYDGGVVQLMDPGARPNSVWTGLKAWRRKGVELYTSFTPTSTERGIKSDLRILATVFSGVFVAAGTG